jgi:hypothetical protein
VDVGTTEYASDIYTSANYGGVIPATTDQATVTMLPADGSTIYVTLYTYNGSGWVYSEAQYTSGP